MPIEDLLKRANRDNYDESVAKSIPLYPGISLTAHVVFKNMQVYRGVYLHQIESIDLAFLQSFWLACLCSSSRCPPEFPGLPMVARDSR